MFEIEMHSRDYREDPDYLEWLATRAPAQLANDPEPEPIDNEAES